ncbi:hypothetical protein BGW41_001299 [Actinomortierella wolfii]|nr:hypothetical protein BGW41_001299 [Actinomortierella wolfii]
MSETSTLSLTSTITSAVATATSTLISATTTLGQPAPTDSPIPTDSNSPPSGDNKSLPPLCDWTREAADCRDADFIRWILVASSVLHLLAFIFGFWLLTYRNRGFNSRIVTELYMKVGTGVRPKPMDCIVFWVCIACIVKIIANFPLIFDVLRDSWWLRIALEQLYWIFVAIAFSSYFVGLLYAMPVTTREGIFAVYQPEVVFGAKPLPPIHVLTPTTVQKNFLLIMGLVYPTLCGACMGITSGILHDMGLPRESRIFLLIQYSNWVLILWSMAAFFFYYGLKYTFILRANIIIAEAALKAPKAAFGLGNLRSSSPARFLFIQLQITGFGGCAVTLLAGSLCMIWVLFKDEILNMKDDKWPHTVAFFWTGAIALAYMVIMALISVQSVRNRRRGLHQPSTSASQSYLPSSSGSKNSAKSQSGQKNLSHQPTSSSDPETRLTEQSSVSTLHSRPSLEKVRGDSLDGYDDPPFAGGRSNDSKTSFLRESVYGGRSLQSTSSNSSHPRISEEPVSVPMVNVRGSGSRASGSRPSISSGHLSNSATSSRVSNTSGSIVMPNSSSASHTTSNSSHFNGITSIPEDTGDQWHQETVARKQHQQYPGHPSSKPRSQPINYIQQPSPALVPNYQHSRSPPQSPRQQPQQQPASPRSRPSLSGASSQQQQPYVHFPQYSSRADVASQNMGNNNVQTQQQHPLHQVAYKGLSPPPRAKRVGPPSTAQVPHSSNSPTLQGYTVPTSSYMATSPPLQPAEYYQYQRHDDRTDAVRVGGGVRRGSQQRQQQFQQQAVRSDSDSEVSVEGLMPMPPTHR